MKGLASSRVATYLIHNAVELEGVLRVPGLNISEAARNLGMHRLTVGKIVHAFVDGGVASWEGNTLVINSIDQMKTYSDGFRDLEYRKR